MSKTYEGMFLLEPGGDFDVTSAPVREVLARAGAEVLSLKPWDERRLAYEIKGQRRGLYVLAYFKAEPARITELQHELQLNEKILRAMMLSADHLKDETIHAETPATFSAARRAARKSAESEQAAKETVPDKGKSAAAEAKPAKPEVKPAKPEAKPAEPEATGERAGPPEAEVQAPKQPPGTSDLTAAKAKTTPPGEDPGEAPAPEEPPTGTGQPPQQDKE